MLNEREPDESTPNIDIFGHPDGLVEKTRRELAERLRADPRVFPCGQLCGRPGKTLGSAWRRSTSSLRVFSISVSFGSIAIFKLQRAVLT